MTFNTKTNNLKTCKDYPNRVFPEALVCFLFPWLSQNSEGREDSINSVHYLDFKNRKVNVKAEEVLNLPSIQLTQADLGMLYRKEQPVVLRQEEVAVIF